VFYPQKTCSCTCSFTCTVIPNRSFSSLRASSPWLEPEKELPCLGEAIPTLIFAHKTLKSAASDPPTRQARASGLPPFTCRCLVWTPTTSAYAVSWCFAPTTVPLLAFSALADSRSLRRHAAHRLALRDCAFATGGGGRALGARRQHHRHLFLDFFCRWC